MDKFGYQVRKWLNILGAEMEKSIPVLHFYHEMKHFGLLKLLFFIFSSQLKKTRTIRHDSHDSFILNKIVQPSPS